MGFGGHVADMISRLRFNDALRHSYRSRHDRIKEAFRNEIAPGRVILKDKTSLTKEQLDEIKLKIRNEIIKERRIAVIKTIVSMVIIIAALVVFAILLLNRSIM